MTEHTPEAQAAYPHEHSVIRLGCSRCLRIDECRAAFDRGRASMVETVTTVEELRELPPGSSVIDADGELWRSDGFPRHWPWRRPRSSVDYGSEAIALPARVLFRPSPEEANR